MTEVYAAPRSFSSVWFEKRLSWCTILGRVGSLGRIPVTDNVIKMKPGAPGSVIETLPGAWKITALLNRRYVVSQESVGCRFTYRLEHNVPVLKERHVSRQMTATELGRLQRSALLCLTQFIHEGK